MSDSDLRLNDAELNMVLTSLAQLPYAQVSELMQKFAERIAPQLAASAQSADMPLKDVKA